MWNWVSRKFTYFYYMYTYWVQNTDDLCPVRNFAIFYFPQSYLQRFVHVPSYLADQSQVEPIFLLLECEEQ